MKSLLATCLLTFAVVSSAAAVDVDEIIDRAERAFTQTRIIIGVLSLAVRELSNPCSLPTISIKWSSLSA
jgi:hypothetical protein